MTSLPACPRGHFDFDHLGVARGERADVVLGHWGIGIAQRRKMQHYIFRIAGPWIAQAQLVHLGRAKEHFIGPGRLIASFGS